MWGTNAALRNRTAPENPALQEFVWVACAPDSGSVYPVKALCASFAALRPAVTGQSLPLKVVHAESGAFGQLGRMNLLLGRRQLDRQRGLALVRQVVTNQTHDGSASQVRHTQ